MTRSLRASLTKDGMIAKPKISWEPHSPVVDRPERLYPRQEYVPIETRSSRGKAMVLAFIMISSATAYGFAYLGAPVGLDARITISYHAPITITSNGDFASQASSEGWAGDGSSKKPYVISDYEIDAATYPTAIYISGTTVHFTIRSCIAYNPSNVVIYLDGVSNGDISNCTLSISTYGIYITNSNNCSAKNTTVQWNSYGVYFYNSENLTLSNGTVLGNSFEGVTLDTCHWIDVSNNSVSRNTGDGILSSGSFHNRIADNTVFRNGNNGIDQSLTTEELVLRNGCTDNKNEGIVAYSTTDNAYNDNLCARNYDGMYIESSTGTTISGNNFSGNNFCGLYLSDMFSAELTANNFSANSYDGLYLEGVGNLLIDNSTCLNNGNAGIEVSGDSGGSRYVSNNCSYQSYGMLIYDMSDAQVLLSECHENNIGMYLNNLQGVSVSYNDCSWTNGDGIESYYALDSFFGHNTCSHVQGAGMYLDYSSSSVIESNMLDSDSGYGLRLMDGTGNRAANNSCTNGNEGMSIEYETRPVLIGNDCSGNLGRGLRLYSCTDAVVSDNHANNNAQAGIMIDTSTGTTAIGNTCSNDGSKRGIEISTSWTTRLWSNTMTGSGVFVWGTIKEEWNTHVISTNNTVNGKPVYYYANATGVSAPTNAGEVIFANCTRSVVDHVSVADSCLGVEVGFSYLMEVSNCSLTDSTIGVYFYYSNESIIADCELIQCELYGIGLETCQQIEMLRNACNYSATGIYASSTDYATVRNNWCNHGESGILLEGGIGAIVQKNECNSALDGIGIYGVQGALVSENQCNNNHNDGIELEYAYTVQLVDNVCSWNGNTGIYMFACLGNTLTGNQMVRDGLVIEGFDTGSWNGHTISTSNTVNGKPLVYLKNQTGGLAAAGAGEVILADCDGVTVSGQNLSMGSTALQVAYSAGCILTNNNCSDGNIGIDLRYTTTTTVADNVMSNNHGDASVGDGSGLQAIYSDSNAIRNNTVALNDKGLTILTGNMNQLNGNLLYGNTFYGTWLGSGTAGNAIWNNTFAYNNGATALYSASHRQARDDTGSNAWYLILASGHWGNYWNDTSGWPDSNHDGILDNPYPLDGTGSASDPFPLVVRTKPFVAIPEFSLLLSALPLVALVLAMRSRKSR